MFLHLVSSFNPFLSELALCVLFVFTLSGPWALFEHWSLGSDAGVCQKSPVNSGSQSVVRGALEVPKILSGGLQDQNTLTVSYHVICLFLCWHLLW